MRRLHTAALAAFLAFSGILGGVGVEAYYFVPCLVISGTGDISTNSIFGDHFQINTQIQCGSVGTSQCCYQVHMGLLESTDGGSHWFNVSNIVDQHAITCGTSPLIGDRVNSGGPGLLRLTAKIETCDGVLVKDLGHLDHQF